MTKRKINACIANRVLCLYCSCLSKLKITRGRNITKHTYKAIILYFSIYPSSLAILLVITPSPILYTTYYSSGVSSWCWVLVLHKAPGRLHHQWQPDSAGQLQLPHQFLCQLLWVQGKWFLCHVSPWADYSIVLVQLCCDICWSYYSVELCSLSLSLSLSLYVVFMFVCVTVCHCVVCL